MNTKISIITVCKNAENQIGRTIDSVLSQTYQNIEYIIIDGASTDGTVEGIRDACVKRQSRVEGSKAASGDSHPSTGQTHGSAPTQLHPSTCEQSSPASTQSETALHTYTLTPNLILKFLSEPDTGIYNAMNKGIALATGDIIYFLNAGDRLFNEGVIENVVKEFVRGGADFIYTDIFCKNGMGGHIKKFDGVDRYFLIRDCISHQSSFYKKEIFEKLGNFNENLKIASDYELLLKIMKEDGFNKRYLPIISAYYDTTGISSTNKELLENERSEIIKRNFSFCERFMLNSFLYRFFRKFSATLKYFLNQYRGGNG